MHLAGFHLKTTLSIVIFFLLGTPGCTFYNQIADPLPPIQYSVAWRRDNQAIAVGGEGLQVIDVNSGSVILQNNTKELDNIRWVSWKPDASELIGVNKPGQAFIWDVPNSNYSRIFQSQRNITSVSWSPDGSKVALSSADKTVKVFDAISFENLLSLNHDDEVHAVAWNSSGDKLLSGSNDGNVKIWDAVTGNLLSNFLVSGKHIYTVAWSLDDSKIAAAGSSSQIFVWDITNGDNLSTLNSAQNADVMQISWKPDGTQIAVAIANTVSIWNLGDNKPALILNNGEGNVYTVAWSYDGNKIGSVGADRTLRIWNAVNGTSLREHQLGN